MAEYNEDKLTKLGALKALAEKIKKDYTAKTDFDELSTKVEGLVSTGGEPNVIEAITVNGSSDKVSVQDKTVDITVPTKVEDLTDGKDYAKSEDVDNKINAKISSVYKPGGSLETADVTKLTADNLGKVYNVSAKFSTDADHFVDGLDKNYPAGTNIVVVEGGSEVYKFDVLSGFVDLTPYATTQSMTEELEKKANVSHTHKAADVTDLEDTLGEYATTEAMTAALANKQDKGDYVTTEKLTSELAKKQDTGDYATNTELGRKADAEHTHTMSQITDLELATPEEVSAMLEEVFAAE